jgi:hypothetical protein
MVIIPDSVTVADGLSFTIGQITWTTSVNSFTATATEETQIQSASTTSSSATAPTALAMAPTTLATAPTTPTTHRSLPRYKGRSIDNTDLIKAIDQVGHKLSQNPDFSRFNSKSIYRAGTSSPQQIYPTSLGSPSNKA